MFLLNAFSSKLYKFIVIVGRIAMATNSEPIQVSSLPLPPMHYINQYTDEMIRRGRAPRPPPPIRDQYQMFGNTFNTEESIIRPLESQVINLSCIAIYEWLFN